MLRYSIAGVVLGLLGHKVILSSWSLLSTDGVMMLGEREFPLALFTLLIISKMMLNGWQNEKGAAGRDLLLTLSQVKRVEIARSSLLGNLRWA